MIQPKYSPQEALERIKLMMEYDSSKTLDENKQTINEVAPLIAAIPWLTAAVASKIGIGALVTAGIGAWIYNTQGGGDSFTKTKLFFAGCSKNMKDLKPTVSKSEYREAADSIYNAIEGIGTDTNAIKAALNSMPTVSDLCALNSWYSTQYGDLYDDLDSDIDGTDFTKYVWSAIAPKIADAEDDLSKIKTDGGKTGWENFSCVPNLANSKGVKISSDGSYLIGNFRYYANGRKGDTTTKLISNYTCNDPEFKTERKGGVKKTGTFTACTENMPIKYLCKNETIKKVQACLGLPMKYQTGNFGPITKQALIDKGQNGDQIDSGTIIAACKETKPTTQSKPIFEPDDTEELSATDILA
jgi:hypothetical protein